MVLNIRQRTCIIWRLGQNNPEYGLRPIALEVGCSHQTVRNIGNYFMQTGIIEPRPKPAKPKKLVK